MPRAKLKLQFVKKPPEYPPELDPVQIGNRLKGFRERLNKSQRAFAEELKINPQTWNNWEKGLRLPDIIELVKLIRRYPEISLDRIYLGPR